MISPGDFNSDDAVGFTSASALTGQRRPAVPAPDRTGLYAGYALILLAVPTFGVAAAIGLLRVWRREPPADALGASHFEFQKRTLIAALAAIVGGVLLIVINVGVFVLFIMAVWTLVRGATGLKALLEGRPINDPRRLFY